MWPAVQLGWRANSRGRCDRSDTSVTAADFGSMRVTQTDPHRAGQLESRPGPVRGRAADPFVAGMVPVTLPNAHGAERGRMTTSSPGGRSGAPVWRSRPD